MVRAQNDDQNNSPPSEVKPIKLRFSGPEKAKNTQNLESQNPEEKRDFVGEMSKNVKNEIQERKVTGKRTVSKRNFKELNSEQYIKLESEELLISSEQKQILELFNVSFKKPKGNREFFIKRDLVSLKEVKPIYKDVILDDDMSTEDLDICPQYGEKINETEDGKKIWRQLDLKAMKQEKRKNGKNITKFDHPNEKIQCEINGEMQNIGERGITTKKPVDFIDNGKIKVLFHGEHLGAHIFIMDITKGGKFVHKVENETVMLRINHASKGSTVFLGSKTIENIESDMIIFVPKKTELTIINKAKLPNALMKIELSIFG